MSWVRRVTLICDSCFAAVTSPLGEPGGNSVTVMMRDCMFHRVRVGEHTFDLCSLCKRNADKLSTQEVEARLLAGEPLGDHLQADPESWDRQDREKERAPRRERS